VWELLKQSVKAAVQHGGVSDGHCGCVPDVFDYRVDNHHSIFTGLLILITYTACNGLEDLLLVAK